MLHTHTHTHTLRHIHTYTGVTLQHALKSLSSSSNNFIYPGGQFNSAVHRLNKNVHTDKGQDTGVHQREHNGLGKHTI